MTMSRLTCLMVIMFASSGLLAASEVDDLVLEIAESMSPLDLAEPGNTLFAEALQELVDADLGFDEADQHALRVRTAAAWLAAQRLQQAFALVKPVLTAQDSLLREQAGLLLVALWQHQLDAGEAVTSDPVAYLAEHGDFSPLVQGRAWLIEAQIRFLAGAHDQSVAACDAALALFAEVERARTPAYQWRVAAMEALRQAPTDIDVWLQQRDDPAVLPLLVQRQQTQIVGRPAPELIANDHLSQAAFDLSTYQGKPVLVYFFATWAQPCGEINPLLAPLQQAHPEWQTVGISLDTADTLPQLGDYIREQQWQFPVVSQGMGWNGDWDEAWFVKGLPQIVVVDAAGRIAAADVTTANLPQLIERIEQALAATAPDQQGAE